MLNCQHVFGSGDGEMWSLLFGSPAPVLTGPHEPAMATGPQLQLVARHQRSPGLLPPNVVRALWFDGPLDVELLRGAVGALVQHHPALRTTLDLTGPLPTPRIAEQVALPLEVTGSLEPEGVDAWLLALARQDLFPASRPGWALRVAQAGEGRWLLALAAHPVSLDALSVVLLLRELAERCRNPAFAPTAGPHPTALARWESEAFAARASDEAFWLQHLRGAPQALELPGDGDVAAAGNAPAERIRFELPSELGAGLGLQGLRLGVSLRDMLLSGLALTLSRICQQQELVVGLRLSGRGSKAHETAIGSFARVAPVRLRVDPTAAAADLIGHVGGAVQEVLAHQRAWPDAVLVPLVREDVTQVQVQALFEIEPWVEAPTAAGDAAWAEPSRAMPSSGLAVRAQVRPDGSVVGFWEFHPAVFRRAGAQTALSAYLEVLAGLSASTETSSARLRILPPEQEAVLLQTWNDNAAPIPGDTCVHELFKAQAARTPDAIAVRHDGNALTFRALEAQSSLLARVLASHGVRPEQRVAVWVRPSLEIPVAFLGILESGGAYLPLDVDAPPERLTFILADAGVQVLVSNESVPAEIAAAVPHQVRLDLDWQTAARSLPPPSISPRPDNLAYVIYTSGSTGEPKGVLVTHASVVNHNLSVARRFGLGPADRLLQFTPIHFDAAGEEIYPPLLAGARMVVCAELVSHQALRRLIDEESLSVLSLPPAYLHEWVTEMVRLGERLPSSLRLVIIGGEKLLPQTLSLWQQCGGTDIPWINVYGPTEATVTAAMCEVSGNPEFLRSPTLPIGRGIDNVQLYLLDAHLELVPVGHPGELYIGGRGLARGYLNRPDLAAEKFIPDPFSARAGQRLYRTGDVARYAHDGILEFLGRVDHQVKLRGFRIEPGEIEAVLRRHPEVGEALVMVREDVPGRPRLVAYFVGTGGGVRADPAALRAYAANLLPDYMLPGHFQALDAFPLTANGKVDRRSLPAPGDGGTEETRRGPSNPTETALAEIWREVLQVPEVGMDDDFFELGGQSLLAIQVVSRVMETLSVDLPVTELFEAPTIALLAERLQLLAGDGPLIGDDVDVEQLSEEQLDEMLRRLR